MSRGARNYTFTINNATELLDLDVFPEVKYFYYQEEISSTGTYHLQGFVCFHKAVRITWIKKHVDQLATAHLEVMGGTIPENKRYCSKPGALGGPYSVGEEPAGQGSRSDLEGVKRAVIAGKTSEELWDENFGTMVRYHKAIEIYKQIKIAPRDFKTITFLILGPPGRGKSTLARILAKTLSTRVYQVPETKQSGLYVDGYDNEEVAILDEMSGSRMKPTMFNGFCDEHEYKANVIGRPPVQWRPKYLFITANHHPRYWWKNRSAIDLLQTTRRIDGWIYMFNPPKQFRFNGNLINISDVF